VCMQGGVRRVGSRGSPASPYILAPASAAQLAAAFLSPPTFCRASGCGSTCAAATRWWTSAAAKTTSCRTSSSSACGALRGVAQPCLPGVCAVCLLSFLRPAVQCFLVTLCRPTVLGQTLPVTLFPPPLLAGRDNMPISGRAYDIILAKDSTDFVLKSWFDARPDTEGLAPPHQLVIGLNPVGGAAARAARLSMCQAACCPGALQIVVTQLEA